MEDTTEICPNYYDIDAIKSQKVKKIAMNMGLRNKLKLFLLFDNKNIPEYFNISTDEIQEFKKNFFNIDELLKNGKLFIIDYLEQTNQTDLLNYFLEGEDFCKVKFGLIRDESIFQKVLREQTLKEAIDSKELDQKIKCIRSIPEKIIENDEISDFIKNPDNQI